MERVENSACCDVDAVNKPEGSIRTTDVHLLSVASSTIRTAAWLKSSRAFFPDSVVDGGRTSFRIDQPLAVLNRLLFVSLTCIQVSHRPEPIVSRVDFKLHHYGTLRDSVAD
jgi:hypothetical protein